MKLFSTAFWLFVLAGSAFAIAMGFVGGRVVAARSLPAPLPAVDLPPPLARMTALPHRVLTGPHSLDAADDPDPLADTALGVAEHRWPQRTFDARQDRARIAVIVADAGEAGPTLAPWLASPLPFAFAVTPAADAAAKTGASVRAAGKTVVVDASNAAPGDVRGMLADGSASVLISARERRARNLLAGLDRATLIVDYALTEDDAVPAVARHGGRRFVTRDVIADAREEKGYVEFMLRNALAIAQRYGDAIVVVHARPASFAAVKGFADRAARDGADIVALAELDRNER